jgi:hypothetical protein
MQANRLSAVLLVLAMLLSSLWLSQPAQAKLGLNFETVFKLGGMALVVDHFGKDIDKFINKILAQRKAEVQGRTKVVSVVRVGGAGAAFGACQVMGPANRVSRVQAVAELEVPIGRLRLRALLPISAKKGVTSTVRGVGGTGVSAAIHFPL